MMSFDDILQLGFCPLTVDSLVSRTWSTYALNASVEALRNALSLVANTIFFKIYDSSAFFCTIGQFSLYLGVIARRNSVNQVLFLLPYTKSYLP